MLLDEPLSNLDASLRQEMKIEIRQLQQSLGLTTIFVTHDQDEAMSTADRMVLMYRGRVEQAAPPAEVYARPRSEFAARFLGVANLLHLTIADSEEVVDTCLCCFNGGQTHG